MKGSIRLRKLLLVVLVFAALVAGVGFNLIASTTAHAQTQTTSTDKCVHQPTIDTLEACVHFMAEQGIITSLLVKLDRTENALKDGRTSRAIHILNAFVAEVNAQSGKYIIPMHAMHLIMHAQLVIDALEDR